MIEDTDTLYKTLYKRTSTGAIQIWSIYYNGSGYYTVTGKDGGKTIQSAPTIVTAKVNRTLEEQILSEVASKSKKQLDKKYVEDKKEVDNAESNLPGFSSLLAKDYEKFKHKVKYPCAAQPKLDGIRNNITLSGFTSRGRKRLDTCSHIWGELEEFYKDNPESKLDGEFYTHEFKDDFEKICKAVKKTSAKATAEDLKLQEKVQLHLYDAPVIGDYDEQDKFRDRQTELAKIFAGYEYVKVVETVYDIQNEDELRELKERWVEEGYEGLMYRDQDAPYEGKRTNKLLKWKDFIDEEFRIIRVNEGSGRLAGHAGSFTFALDSDLSEEDEFIERLDTNTKTFDAKMIGSSERLKYYFENPEECLGKLATVRYQNRTADNMPRFPVCRGLRDYE
jgi:DNA ligase-1